MRNAFATLLATAILAGGVSLAPAGPSAAADDPANVIKYRQTLMKTLGGHMGSIGMIAKGEVSYDNQNIENQAAAIALMATLIPNAFMENAGDAAKNEAKPEIWADWSGFEAKAQNLFEASTGLSEAAAAGDQTRIGAAIGATGKACGACHDSFRVKN